MNVPILKQGRMLICSFQDSLSDREMVELRQELAHRVSVHRALGVIIDVTVLDLLDSFAAHTLTDLARTLALRGAHTVIAGIQPDVAYSMVQLGLRMDGVETALDLEDAMDRLQHVLYGKLRT